LLISVSGGRFPQGERWTITDACAFACDVSSVSLILPESPPCTTIN